MKKVLLSLTLAGSLFAVSYPVDITENWDFDANVFKDYVSSTYPYHPGVDINWGYKNKDLGKSVYAIACGKVVEVKDMGKLAYGIMIEHNINEKTYYSAYVHVNSLVSEGDFIREGDEIATLADISAAGLSSHLHFEIRDTFTGTWYPNSVGTTGYYSSTSKIDNNGFLDPISFLNTYANKSGACSYFDGAGSLINAPTEGWGYNKDMAKMHSHDIPSTVVFQAKRNGSCNSVEISSSPNKSLNVAVKLKAWDENIIEDSYIVKLPTIINLNKTWNTIAVISKEKLSSSEYITMKCNSNAAMSKSGFNDAQPSKDYSLVGFQGKYYWSGNGSLIAGKYTGNTFGKDIDYVSVFYDKKSLMAFQWLPTDNCQELQISELDSYGGNNLPVSISMKKWDEDETKWKNKCSKIPCIINRPNNDYYLIKIKNSPEEGAYNGIKADCIKTIHDTTTF